MKTKTPATTEPGAKGQQRRAEILAGARKILVNEGYAALTMRRIARDLGLRLSHVQYYFSTVDGVIEALLGEYLDAARTRLGPGKEPADFSAVLSEVLRQQESKVGFRTFWELWAMTGHDREVSRRMDQFYSEYLSGVEAFVRDINPDLSSGESRLRAVLVTSLLEGVSLFRGYGRNPPVPDATLVAGVESVVRLIATGRSDKRKGS